MGPGSDFERLAYAWLHLITGTPEMKMFTSGYLLKDILDRLTSKAQSTLKPDLSFHMYFAHDITLGAK